MLPTPDSTGTPLKIRFDRVVSAVQRARLISINEKAKLAAGNVAIEQIIDNIYLPFARRSSDGGIWHTIQEFSIGKLFQNFYANQLFQRLSYEPGDANLTTDRVSLDGNTFPLDAKVEWQGTGTPPAPLTKGTNYWVKDKQGQGISFSATLGGAKIDLTTQGTGSTFVSLRVGADFNTLITEVEAVIDEIIAMVPVTTTTLELRNVKFDKGLISSTNGLQQMVLTPAQTATLRTKLQAVTDAIGVTL